MAPPRRPRRVEQARASRLRPTPAEARLWTALRNDRLGFHFRRQVPIGPLFADSCCAKAALVIEVDGGVHAARVEADASRTALLDVVRPPGERVPRLPARSLADETL